MGWVFLELAVVLAIAALIVWWTLPRKRGPQPREADAPEAGGPSRDQ
jgi:hypothetical protein